MERGWWWRYDLLVEKRIQSVRRGARAGYDSLSIDELELFDMVWITYVMILIRKELPERNGEVVLMRGDNAWAVQ